MIRVLTYRCNHTLSKTQLHFNRTKKNFSHGINTKISISLSAESLQKMYILKLTKQNIINVKGRAEVPTEGSRDRLFPKTNSGLAVLKRLSKARKGRRCQGINLFSY